MYKQKNHGTKVLPTHPPATHSKKVHEQKELQSKNFKDLVDIDIIIILIS